MRLTAVGGRERKSFAGTIQLTAQAILHRCLRAEAGVRYGATVKLIMATPQEQYDDAMFDFSTGDFDSAIAKLRAVLTEDPANFEAQLALGMAWYRKGDYAIAIAEGHKAEKLKPHEQLVHTNLSLFYMKSGDKTTAEHHGLQARIASWKGNMTTPGAAPATAGDPELELAKPKPQAFKLPEKFPEQPWKKKPKVGGEGESNEKH